MQLDPGQLAALSAVLRLGSFDRAAANLGVTPSAISQRLKALEERVGTTLVERGQPCLATRAGTRLAKHAEDIALLEADALKGIMPDTGDLPRIRIALNADSLATWVVPALAEVRGLLFDLVIDDQDHADGWLRRGDVSAAVTGIARPAPGCDVVPLGVQRYEATCAPAFFEAWFSSGVNANSLGQAPMLTYNEKDQLQSRWITRLIGAHLAPPAHQLPSTHAFVDAALAGLGWGMNPETLITNSCERNKLVKLHKDQPLDVPLFWQVSRRFKPVLNDLTQAIVRAARKGLRDIPVSS